MVVATERGTSEINIQNLFNPEESMEVNLPFVVLFAIHSLLLLREICITKDSKVMRLVEFLLMVGFSGFFALEMVRDFKSEQQIQD